MVASAPPPPLSRHATGDRCPTPAEGAAAVRSMPGRMEMRAAASRAGLLQTALYRYSSLRWVAAAGAAAAAFLALNSSPIDSDVGMASGTAMTLEQEQLAARLPTATRGVSIPTASGVLVPGDRVDVHGVLTGSPVVNGALVVEVTAEDTLIAVPRERVDAVVESMADGGVMLVLVPPADH